MTGFLGALGGCSALSGDPVASNLNSEGFGSSLTSF